MPAILFFLFVIVFLFALWIVLGELPATKAWVERETDRYTGPPPTGA